MPQLNSAIFLDQILGLIFLLIIFFIFMEEFFYGLNVLFKWRYYATSFDTKKDDLQNFVFKKLTIKI